jgi:hypothetical protein
LADIRDILLRSSLAQDTEIHHHPVLNNIEEVPLSAREQEDGTASGPIDRCYFLHQRWNSPKSAWLFPVLAVEDGFPLVVCPILGYTPDRSPVGRHSPKHLCLSKLLKGVLDIFHRE